MVKKKLGMDDVQFNEIVAKLEKEYGSLYDALEDASKKGEKTFASLELPEAIGKEIVKAAKEKIASPKYEVGSHSGDELEGVGRDPANQGGARRRLSGPRPYGRRSR